MVSKHLAKGSAKPARVEGKLRLYGMRFCPFVQRIRLVLEAKGLEYDEVFVCLKNKPEWIYEVNAQGKVPVLDTGDEVLAESLDIADFLDEKHPEPPLYPVSSRKAEDKELIETHGKIAAMMAKAFYNKENRPMKDYYEEVTPTLQELEDILTKRGTTFFSGEQPGMIDYMSWPWIERFKLPAVVKNEEYSFPREKFPKLVTWRKAMALNDVVKKTMFPQEKHARFLKANFVENRAEYLDDEF